MPLNRSPILKKEPAGTIRSMDELFAIANAMEREAADCYERLAHEMRLQNRRDLEIVFANLAAVERGHVECVTGWSHDRLGKPPAPSFVLWQAPETFDRATTTEITTSRFMTPYRALTMAVWNEERAFAFWTYIAGFAEDSEIKGAAETMAREELGHLSILRKERRRAYHREQSDKRVADREGDVSAISVDAGVLERRLAELISVLGRRLDVESEQTAADLVRETTNMSVQATGFGAFPANLALGDADAIAEALADAYLQGADTSDEAGHLEVLQMLAQRAIVRLAWLRTFPKTTACSCSS